MLKQKQKSLVISKPKQYKIKKNHQKLNTVYKLLFIMINDMVLLILYSIRHLMMLYCWQYSNE